MLHNSEWPVWTGDQTNDTPAAEFAIRNILAAVDFSSHSFKTVRWAQEMAKEFGAELTLAPVTPSAGIYGPGGRNVLAEMKQELDASAAKRMAKFQQESGVESKVPVGSGDVPKVIGQIAEATRPI